MSARRHNLGAAAHASRSGGHIHLVDNAYRAAKIRSRSTASRTCPVLAAHKCHRPSVRDSQAQYWAHIDDSSEIYTNIDRRRLIINIHIEFRDRPLPVASSPRSFLSVSERRAQGFAIRRHCWPASGIQIHRRWVRRLMQLMGIAATVSQQAAREPRDLALAIERIVIDQLNRVWCAGIA